MVQRAVRTDYSLLLTVQRFYNIEQQLLNMFGEKDGKTDRILGFTKAVTGAYYYAPSIEQLNKL